MQLQTRSGLGIAIALLGGLLISIDIPIIRLAEGNPWVVMFMRGFGLSLVLGMVLLFARHWTETPDKPFTDRAWVEVGILYGISSILFTISIFHTSTANLVFILAFNPMIAALFAWWFIGERPGLVTWIAIILTFTGVAIIVGDGLQGGTLFGDLTSLATAIMLALSLTRTRQSGKDLSLCGCLGGAITALFALPLAIMHFEIPAAPLWLLLNVLILVPASGFTLSLAPRFIPAPQVAIFFLLETILAPIWIWLIFAEVPTDNTLIGGAIVLVAISGHSLWQVWSDIKKAKPVTSLS
ncbi:MAG: DMT family transporter [Pseudomonadota bacterium]